VGSLIVHFTLEGLGGSLQGLIEEVSYSGSYSALAAWLEKHRDSIKPLMSALNITWEAYAMQGAMLVYPWEEERKQVILTHARANNTRATCLRAVDPLLVLNVLARARTNLLQPRAPLALESSYLERSLIADDARLIKLAQLTGYIEEIIPEEAKLDEEAEE
jgi:hypothetical protein